MPEVEYEGDVTSWHIRLVNRIEILQVPAQTIETWALFNGDTQESSPQPKESVARWRDEELAKLCIQGKRK